MGSTGGIGGTGSWGATASATPSSDALSTVALDRDLPNADTDTATDTAAALGAVARRTQDLVARGVDAQLLCDRTGGGVTNARHGPAIETTNASTRADILVMAVMWPPGTNSLL